MDSILQSIREIYAREVMTNIVNAMTPVYFACSKCALLSRTIQIRCSKARRLDCADCKAPAHRWFGLYDFVNWKPVRFKASITLAISVCGANIEANVLSGNDDRRLVCPLPKATVKLWGDMQQTQDEITGLRSTSAGRHWHNHRDALLILDVNLPMECHEVALLQQHSYEDIAGGRDRKKQVIIGHYRRRPEGEQETEIDRMAHHLIEQRRSKTRMFRFPAS
jgi:hypothetical protein